MEENEQEPKPPANEAGPSPSPVSSVRQPTLLSDMSEWLAKRGKLIFLFLLGATPLYVNYFYMPGLSDGRNPLKEEMSQNYWAAEFITWVFLPILVYFLGRQLKVFTPESLGFRSRLFSLRPNLFLTLASVALIFGLVASYIWWDRKMEHHFAGVGQTQSLAAGDEEAQIAVKTETVKLNIAVESNEAAQQSSNPYATVRPGQKEEANKYSFKKKKKEEDSPQPKDEQEAEKPKATIKLQVEPEQGLSAAAKPAGKALQDGEAGQPTWMGLVRPVLIVLFWSFTAGMVEEFYFRGLLRQILGRGFAAMLSFLALSTILFSFIHWDSAGGWDGNVKQLAATAGFGLMAALAYLVIQNLWPIIFAHILIDVILFSPDWLT